MLEDTRQFRSKRHQWDHHQCQMRDYVLACLVHLSGQKTGRISISLVSAQSANGKPNLSDTFLAQDCMGLKITRFVKRPYANGDSRGVRKSIGMGGGGVSPPWIANSNDMLLNGGLTPSARLDLTALLCTLAPVMANNTGSPAISILGVLHINAFDQITWIGIIPLHP